MDNLKNFYQMVENSDVLKEKMEAIKEEIKSLSADEQDDAAINALLHLAKEQGIALEREDILGNKGAVDDEELENVSGGGIKGGCFVTNVNCSLFGEIDNNGGCIILGLYK